MSYRSRFLFDAIAIVWYDTCFMSIVLRLMQSNAWCSTWTIVLFCAFWRQNMDNSWPVAVSSKWQWVARPKERRAPECQMNAGTQQCSAGGGAWWKVEEDSVAKSFLSRSWSQIRVESQRHSLEKLEELVEDRLMTCIPYRLYQAKRQSRKF